MNEQPLCPRCEGGTVKRGLLSATGERISSCDECDATWAEGATVAEGTFTDFGEFLAARGLAFGEVEEDPRGRCPYCGQSGLRRWPVRPTSELITLCQECDSVWAFDTPVAKSTSTDFEAFLSTHGLPYDFGLLEAIHDNPTHGTHLPTM